MLRPNIAVGVDELDCARRPGRHVVRHDDGDDALGQRMV